MFKVKTSFQDLPVGTLLLKGEYSDDEKSIEYFDMSREMETGASISYYGVNESNLEPASEEEERQVFTFLTSLYN